MMRSPHLLERSIGICWYASDTPGIGGVLRTTPDDFVVEEIPLPPRGEGPYLIVRMTKRDWELHHAVKEIARRLGISHRRIGWAGTKDKRAVTTQLLSIYNVSPEEILQLGIRDISLTPVGSAAMPLHLGDLGGNRFEVTIRHCSGGDLSGRVAEVAGIAGEAIPNYFGIQRFGVTRPVTHLVGKQLLEEDFEGAVITYVGESFPREHDDIRSARSRYFASRDAAEALKLLPVRLRYERAMLHHLVSHPGDYAGALHILHPKLLSMFVSAYQSYLFNLAVSERIGECPDLREPMIGDRLLFHDGREDRVSPGTIRTARTLIQRRRCDIGVFIPGSRPAPVHGRMDEYLRHLLESDGIGSEQFSRVSEFVNTRFSGAVRALSLSADISCTCDADVAMLSFSLKPGQYATTVCREFMKAEPGSMI